MPLTPQMNGACILLLVRDNINTWEKLCRVYGFPESEHAHSFTIWLAKKLVELKGLGLIDFKADRKVRGKAVGQIRILSHWGSIQLALGGPKLVDLAQLGDPQSMVVKPQFGPPTPIAAPARIFVLMPFLEKMKPVYEDHLKKVAGKLGLSIARADDFFTAHALISDIWAGICAAEMIVADCTGKNPNVFYEIGVAHVLGKKVILITQNAEDVPVDLKHVRYLQYENTPRGMQQFETALEGTLRTELGLQAQAAP